MGFTMVLILHAVLLLQMCWLLWRRAASPVAPMRVQIGRDGCAQFLTMAQRHRTKAMRPWHKVSSVSLDPCGPRRFRLRILPNPLWAWPVPADVEFDCTPAQADALRARIDELRRAGGETKPTTNTPARVT